MPTNNYLLLAFLFLELAILSVFQTYYNYTILPLSFLATGLCIVYFSFKAEATKTDAPYITLGVLSLGIVGYMVYRAPLIFELIPIDFKIADMLPVMERMAERSIEGQDVYAQIPEIWGGMDPVYLPAMWLPLVLAKVFVLDIRWIAVVGMLSLIPLVLFIRGHRPKMVSLIGILLPLGLFLLWHFRFQLNIMTMSNEGLVFFYYALVCFSISIKHPIGIGISMALCLLSRYMLAPWCLLIAVIYFQTMKKSFNIKLLASGLITGIGLMSFGNAWNYLRRFLALPEHYVEALVNNPSKYEPLISESLSLMRYFDYEAVTTVHGILGFFALLVPLLGYGYWFRFKPSMDKLPLFAMGILKLSLVFFYAWLTMPYHYLYYTSFIVSLCIASYVMNAPHEAEPTLS